MSGSMVALWGIVFLLVLMIVGLPISISMLLASFAGLAYIIDPTAASSLTVSTLWSQFSSYTLMVIPMFVFMGTITYRSGITSKLYDVAYKWVGSQPGGLASTTIVASMLFSAICGSNTATASTMGTIALPEMKRFNYRPSFSGGAIAVGATLGVIIPPSVLLIIVSIQTGQSLIDLFLASTFPGILLTIFFVASVYVMTFLNPELGPRGPETPWLEKIKSLTGITETMLLFLLVMYGLYAGWFTPTEAGAAGAFGALIIALGRGGFTWTDFQGAVGDALRVSAMVILLLAGAVLFGRFMSITRLPHVLANWAGDLPIPVWAILIVILVIYLIGGCVTDALGFLIVTIPIFFPVAEALDVNLLWFSILVAVTTTLGAITPPVGINVYIVAGLDPDINLKDIFIGITPYFISFIICIGLMLIFPEIVLWLPWALL